MVLSQLRACGVVETLKISHKGYPSRYLYNEFAEMFYILIRSNLWTNDDKLLTERVVKETIKGDDLYQMGKTQIFFRSGQIANLDSLRSQKQEEVAILLQKHIRAAFERHTYQALKISILSLQALIRAANARKLYKLKKETKAALIIQSRVRGILARKYKVQIAQAAVTVQKLFHAKLAKAKYVKLLRERATIRIQAAWRRYIAQKELRRRISLILFIQSRVRRHEDRQTYFRLRAESKSAGKLKEINNALDAKIISLSAAMAAKNQELKEMEERIKVLEARSATDKLRMVVEAAKYKNRHKKETEALEKLKLEKLQSDENWKLIVKQKDDEIRKLNGEISKIKAESEKQIDDVKQNFEYVESIQRKNSAMSNSSNIQRRPTYLSANNSLLPKSNVTLPVTGNWIVPMIASPAGSDNGMEDEPQNNVTEIIANLKKENEALKAQMEKAIAGKWRGSVIPNNMRRGTLNRMNSLAPSKIGSPFASPSSPIGLGAPQVSNTMVSSPTASAPGSPSQRIFGQTIRESVETIAKVKKLETEILDSLIRNLRIPVPTINPKLKRKEILYPAHLMGNLILHLMMTGQVNGASQLISSIIREIRNTVSESVSEDGFIQAFWLSNTYELSINLQRAAHSPADGRRRTTFDEDVHLRVEVHLKDLDQLVHELYQAFVKTRRSQLSKLFIPGLIENQSLPNYYCRAGRNLAGNDSKTGKSALDELILVIQRSVNIMRGYHTDEGIVRQFAAEMTKFVGVSGFNNLLMRKNFCTWKRGVQIQYNVSRIEDWCIEQNFSQVLFPLQRLQQAAKLLTLNKSSVADLNVMIDVCNLLTLTQIKRLLSIFYAVEAFSNPSPDLLKALSVRIGLESQRNSDSLLLDLDYNADFVKPIGSGAIAKAETYVPPWVSVPTVIFHAKLAKAKYVKLLRDRATIRIQAAWRRYIAQKELRHRISLILFIQSRVRRHEDRQTYFRLRAESKSAGKLKEINNALDAKIISLSAAMAAKNQELKEMEERIKVLEARSATDKLRMVVEAAKYKNRHKKETEALEKLKLEKLQSDENWKLIVKQKDDEIRKLNGEISKIKAESEKQIDDVKQNFEYVESIQRKNSAMSNSSNIQRRPTYLSANNSLLPKSNVTLPVTGNWIVPMIASPAGSDNGMEDEPQNNVTEIIANLKKENEALKAQMEKAIAGKWRGSVIPNNMRRGTLNRMNSLAPSKIGSPFASPSSPIGLGAPQVSNTMVSSPTASAPGSPSQRIFGQTIRESVETIAKVKKLETEILDSLIRNLRIPVPTINPKLKRKEILYPAHLMGNLILHLMMTGQVNGASQLISSIIREIRNTVSESVSEDGFIQAFWLSNTYELSINLQRAAHSPADGRRRTTFDEDVHLRVEVHLKDLDQLVHELYQAFVKTRRSQLSKLFIPGLIENQSLPNYYCRAGRNLAGNDSKTGKSALDELILVIQRSVNIMRGYHTDEGIVRQFAAEMTKFVGVSGFNNLLMRKNFCTWKRGVQIQYNVSRIEDWCIEQNFSQVLFPLQRLQQAAKLLTLNKSSVADLNVMIDVCNLLTLTQIKRLLSIFYAVEAFSNPSPDLLKALSVRIGLESQRNSDSLLLDLDYNADFVKPIGSGAIAKAETYVPPWVSVPTVSETLLAVS
ncbi:Myosin type-2 heavy chain 1 [Nowakowskiella sp. JEL0407]|nr:Myosin type-2 heavy chain 1 [Nowakowskiella sp. JEL0407]